MRNTVEVPRRRTIFLLSTGWAGFVGALFFGVFFMVEEIPIPHLPIIYVAFVVFAAIATGAFTTWYLSRPVKGGGLSHDV